MKTYLIIFISIIIFTACGSTPTNTATADFDSLKLEKIVDMQRINSALHVIDLSESKNIPYSEICEEVRYIHLDDKNGFIGDIENIISYDTIIYIQDAKQDAVFIYNRQGKSINAIKSKGRGPKEYLGVGTMSIDPATAELILTDRIQNQLFIYDLQGHFKRKQKLHLQTAYGVVLTKDIFACFSHPHMNAGIADIDDYSIMTVSGDSVIARGFKYYPVQMGAMNNMNLFKNSENNILFKPTYSDTVYHIASATEFYPKYVVRYGKESVWDKNKDSKTALTLGVESINWLSENGKQLLLHSTALSEPKNVIQEYIYSNRTGNAFCINKMSLEDQITQGGIDYLNSRFATSCLENQFISAVSYNTFDELKTLFKQKAKIKHPDLIKILTEDKSDNPIIVFTKYKNM